MEMMELKGVVTFRVATLNTYSTQKYNGLAFH
jgi:hypothetical protein